MIRTLFLRQELISVKQYDQESKKVVDLPLRQATLYTSKELAIYYRSVSYDKNEPEIVYVTVDLFPKDYLKILNRDLKSTRYVKFKTCDELPRKKQFTLTSGHKCGLSEYIEWCNNERNLIRTKESIIER